MSSSLIQASQDIRRELQKLIGETNRDLEISKIELRKWEEQIKKLKSKRHLYNGILHELG